MWMSLKEKRPEIKQWVLLYCSGDVYSINCLYDYNLINRFSVPEENESEFPPKISWLHVPPSIPTHWIPLPSAPEEQTCEVIYEEE